MHGSPERHAFQVALTSAFSTGTPLRVRLADYANLQDAVGKQLELDGSVGWSLEAARWHGVSSYGKGAGGYSNLVPLVIAQREGDALKATAPACGDLGGGAANELRGELDGWHWDFKEIKVELYDLGVGVTTGVYDISAPPGMAPDDAARAVYSWTALDRDQGLSPLAAAYEALARESVDAFRNAVQQSTQRALPDPWLPSRVSVDGRRWPDGDMERGRLLWLHPVYVVRGEPHADTAELEALAQPYRSTYSQTVEYPDGLFVPGIQKSVIVVRGDFALKEEPLKMTTLNWAYYALFMEMDRGLLASLDDERWEQLASLRQLEQDAEQTYRAFLRFQEAKARLESALTGLGPRQTNLWAPIADVTRFGELAAGVENKLEVLRTVAEGRVREATVRSSRRSRNILTGLTALTVVTVVVGLVDHIVGSRTDPAGHGELRAIFIVLAFLGAMIVYLLAERDFSRVLRRERSARADD